MLRFGHLGLSFLEHGFGDTAKFLSVPHLRDSTYVEKVQGSTSIPWGHLWPKHYNIDWRSTTRVSVSCLFSPESRLRLMKVHVSTWTDQQGHQALRMVQARLFSPGTWFWHIFYRNCGIEYTLRSEIRWRCYQNNNFTAAKMLINHSICGYFPMLRHAWKNAHPGFGHRRCVVSLHVSAMRRCFSSIAQAHCICIAEDAPWSHTRRHGPVIATAPNAKQFPGEPPTLGTYNFNHFW